MEIHVRIKGQTYGPYSPAQVQELVDSGRLKPQDPAWREGLAEWATLAQMLSEGGTPLHPPAPSGAREPRCPQCDAPLGPQSGGACAHCGYDPRVVSRERRHRPQVDPMVEEARRKSTLTRLALALLLGGLLPVYTGNARLAFPNLQFSGLATWGMAQLIFPIAMGAALLLLGGALRAPWRGVAGLGCGLLLWATSVAAAASTPPTQAWLPQWLEQVCTALFLQPASGVLLAVGAPAMLVASQLRRYRPNSRAAYWTGCAGGALVLMAWLLPLGPEESGGVLLVRTLALFQKSTLIGLAGLAAIIASVGAAGTLALASDGRSTDGIANLCGHAQRLLTAGGALVAVLLLAEWTRLHSPVGDFGKGWLRQAGLAAAQAGLTLKALLWHGGGALLLVWAATDLLAGRSDAQDGPASR